MSLTTSAFSWRNEDDVAFIEMNVMGESVNTLKAEFAGELEQILQSILSLPSIKGIVFFSGKSDSFIVGADINLLDGCKSAQEAECLAVAGQKLFATLAQFPLPIVAAIHGACLGGGLELALACQARVISDAPKTQLGLPEVQLGLLPGSGGTQRLPRLVGVITALDMMLKGKPLRAKQALRVGLADDLVPQSILLATAKQMALHPKPRAPLSWWLRLHHSPLGLALIMAQARKKVQSNTLGHYPAPFEILHVVEQGLKQGVEKGLAQEAQRFGVLVASQESKQLRQLFFATQQLKKVGMAVITDQRSAGGA